jgi:prepilin-type N-terminal cleavage/methylation domain-containing protein
MVAPSRWVRGGFLPRLAPQSGFTLIEVLVAMVILAIGLLGLTALGVNAVYSVGLAERNTRAAATATRYVEDAVAELRRNVVPEQRCDTLPNQDRVSREIALSGSLLNGGRRARVTVTVTPEPRGRTPHPLSMSSHVFSASGFNNFSGSPDGSPC